MIFDLSHDSGSAPDLVHEKILRSVLGQIETVPACVRTDTNGRITEINPSFSQLCGYTFGEVCGRKPGSILQGDATTEESIEIIRQAIHERRACTVEMLNYHKDNSPYRVLINLRPLFDSEGQHLGFEALETKLP